MWLSGMGPLKKSSLYIDDTVGAVEARNGAHVESFWIVYVGVGIADVASLSESPRSTGAQAKAKIGFVAV